MPCWLSKLDVLGAHSSGLKSWGARYGIQTSLLEDPIVGHCAGDGVYGEIVSQPLLTTSMWGFSHLHNVVFVKRKLFCM